MLTRMCRGHTRRCAHMYTMHIPHTHVRPHGYMCPHIQVNMPTRMCGEHTRRCAHRYAMHAAHTCVPARVHVTTHTGVHAHTRAQKSRHTHTGAHTHAHTDLTDAPPPSSKLPLTGCGITLFRLYSDPLTSYTPTRAAVGVGQQLWTRGLRPAGWTRPTTAL